MIYPNYSFSHINDCISVSLTSSSRNVIRQKPQEFFLSCLFVFVMESLVLAGIYYY